jgi:uncharacterized membrane protein YciS (DUF1049 family)
MKIAIIISITIGVLMVGFIVVHFIATELWLRDQLQPNKNKKKKKKNKKYAN